MEKQKSELNSIKLKLNNTQSCEKIKLDVGGTQFSTLKTTLTSVKGSFFSAMFGGRWNPKEGTDGSYFIDRDPLVFPQILNYLREGTIIDLEYLSPRELKILKLDSDFYCLASLSKSFNQVKQNPKVHFKTFIHFLE